MKSAIGFANGRAVLMAFVSALAGAFLSTLPLGPYGEQPFYTVCLWVLGTGFLTVCLYSWRTGMILSGSDGARLGWMTGVLASVLFLAITLTKSFFEYGGPAGMRRHLLGRLGGMPAGDPAAERVAQFLTSAEGLTIFFIMYVILGLVSFGVLALVGGVLGAKVLKKD